MYKQKKNEKSTKNKWKRSRSRMYGIGILIVTLCLTACEKEEHRMEEIQLEEVEKVNRTQKSGRTNLRRKCRTVNGSQKRSGYMYRVQSVHQVYMSCRKDPGF